MEGVREVKLEVGKDLRIEGYLEGWVGMMWEGEYEMEGVVMKG